MSSLENPRSPARLIALGTALYLLSCGGNDEKDSATNGAGTPISGTDDVLIDPGSGNGSPKGDSRSLNQDGCSPNFTGIVRDFRADHPDFEAFAANGIAPGIVEESLGADRKPVYRQSGTGYRDGAHYNPNGQQVTTSRANFDQWYRTTDGVNQEFAFIVPFEATGTALHYSNAAFFPIDGRGFGDTNGHNYWFTFELHTTFTYEGGEVFTFVGDDDLWAFINGKLAVDVGGTHEKESGTVNLDNEASRLGLEVGNTYPLDLFHAERHTVDSNFQVETNIVFNNCDPIFTDDVQLVQ